MALLLICTHSERAFLLWCRVFKRTLEITGPAFVKFGQWAAVRSDIFPKAFCEVLCDLHANVTPHSLRQTRRIIKRSLGAEVEEIFEEFDPKPVGSGSIAQVYFAKLKETGEEVAVKVCHPKVQQRIAVDFYCIQVLAKLADRWAPWMDYPGIAQQFARNLSLQVDLRYEAENLNVFNENFRKSHYIIFPKPILATDLVLVETRVDGRPLERYYGGDGTKSPVHRHLATAGADLFLQMLLTDNFFHADIHPGNILVSYGKADPLPFLAVLDVGVCQTLTKHQRDVSHEFLRAIVTGDWLHVGDAVLKMAQRQDYCDVHKFSEDVKAVCDREMPVYHPETWGEKFWYYGRMLGLLPRSPKKTGMATTFVEGIFGAIQQHHVRIDPAYASLLLSCLMMEAIANQCDPTMDVVSYAAPWFVSSMLYGPKRHAK
eukprot:EG_transcript_7940